MYYTLYYIILYYCTTLYDTILYYTILYYAPARAEGAGGAPGQGCFDIVWRSVV